MRCKIIYVPSLDIKLICKELDLNYSKIDFKPNLIFIFLTENIAKVWRTIVDLTSRRFPEARILGTTVAGYFVEGKAWTRGVVSILIETENFTVKVANEESAESTIRKFLSFIPKNFNSAVIFFTPFKVSNTIEAFKFYLKDKFCYRKFQHAKDNREQIEALGEFYNYLDSKKIIYAIDAVMEGIGKVANMPVLGFNNMGMSTPLGLPVTFLDSIDVSKGILGLFLKNANVVFEDTFPERGKSYEETVEILKNESYVVLKEKVKVKGYGPLVTQIGGMKYSTFVSRKLKGLIYENDFQNVIKKLEEGKFEMVVPHGLMLISKRTFGSYLLGLEPTTIINFYFPLVRMENFFEDTWIIAEKKIKKEEIARITKKAKFEDSTKLFLLDNSILPMYGAEIYRVAEKFKLDNSVALLTSCPSAYLPKPERRFMCEIIDNVCCSLGGVFGLIEIF